MVSIIKSIGPDKISWTNVNIPAGRTKAGSQKMYEILTTVAAEVTMTSGSAITPSTRKRKAAISSDNDGTTALPKTKKTRAPRKMTASKAMDSTTNVTDDNEEGAHNEDELTIMEEAGKDFLLRMRPPYMLMEGKIPTEPYHFMDPVPASEPTHSGGTTDHGHLKGGLPLECWR